MRNYNSRDNDNSAYPTSRRSTPASRSYTNRDITYGVWKFIRSILIVIVALMLVLSMIYFGVDYFLNNYWLPTSSEDTTSIQVDIPKGTSVSSITEILYGQGLINNPKVFEYYIDFSGYGKKMQAGVYSFNKTMTMEEIMINLSEGAGAMLVTDFMIIEGSSISTTTKKLLSDGVITDANAFLTAAKNIEEFTSYSFISDVASEANPSREYVLEGYLYPAKYEIYVGSSEATIIKKMLTKFSDVFNEKRTARAKELDMTIDEVVTLASIIERESRPNDFAKVSAVFTNRLDDGMKLKSCATVQYILGTNKIKLSDTDISIDSKYNTYMYAGLPDGPICSPSDLAIDAALYPDDEYLSDGYLFFATKDPESGELAFSKTASEHAAVVAQYEDLWIEYDKTHGN